MPDAAPGIHASSLRCVSCGYDLTGATIGSQCPECGTPIEQSLQARREPPSNSTATTCMVVGILSLVLCGILGPVAIILYFSAKNQMATGVYSASSMTTAKAGLVMGIISTVLASLYLFVFVLMGLSF